MFKFTEHGMTELTANGATSFTAEQTAEVFELLDVVRTDGRGPNTVMKWLNASERPRALGDMLAQAARARGFDFGCPECFGFAAASRHSAGRSAGVRSSLEEHLIHVRGRGRALPPGTTRKTGGLPARDAILDDDERQGEPDYLG